MTAEARPALDNLTAIRNAAAPSFEDPAATSVNLNATWGPVHVFRDGTVYTGHLIDGKVEDPDWNGSQIVSVL